MFNLVYPVFHVGFHCKSCVRESVWRLKAKWRSKKFSQVAHEMPSREVKHVISTWLECGESWQLVFASVLRVRPSREIPAKRSVLPICHIWYTMSLTILYIPTLPTDVEVCFSKRKPKPQPLRVRDCYAHNSLHNPLWFSSTPTSQFPLPWEFDRLNTYHTHSECQVRFWCC